MSSFNESPLTATIIAAHGRHYVAQTGNTLLQCVTRGKKSDVAVGDIVQLTRTSADQAVIDSINERKTLLYRSDQYKSKFLAANVSQLCIVVAPAPNFSDDLLSRSLIAAEAASIPVHIILNKIDLAAPLAKARERLAIYRDLGYPIHEISASAATEAARGELTALCAGQSTLLIGQSGMGKSTIVNLMAPHAQAATREISTALNSGKHTTTFTRLYSLATEHTTQHTTLIDSPGFQEFGLYHLSEGKLERAFREFAPHLGNCRFYNCHHLQEPGCTVLAALAAGTITAARHSLYCQLVHEASQHPHY